MNSSSSLLGVLFLIVLPSFLLVFSTCFTDRRGKRERVSYLLWVFYCFAMGMALCLHSVYRMNNPVNTAIADTDVVAFFLTAGIIFISIGLIFLRMFQKAQTI